ncbi:hypothetical protein [Parasitella parasitica]|uniref:Uncharacterized protein n=1 Tax=Parasitella parasitica TaxID=35722 RepID=A0A0B7NTK4_9FUNG|nr:hypothetical protein [Parasitella parasitica]
MAENEMEWCLDNAASLSLKAFAVEFGFQEKSRANNCYKNILKSHAFKSCPFQSKLIDQFESWKGSTFERTFWNEMALNGKRQRTEALLESDAYDTAAHFSLRASSELRATRSSNDQTIRQAKLQFTSDRSVHESSSNDSSFAPESGDSSSEEDPAYSARKARFDYLVSTNSKDEVVLVDSSVQWILSDGFNVSRSFIEKRNTLTERCRSDKSKLSVQEQLALSGILLLDDRHQSDFLNNTHYFQACRDMKLKYGLLVTEDQSMPDLYKCMGLIQKGESAKVDDLLDNSHIPIRFKTILFSLNRTYGTGYSIKDANENTIVKDCLLPILDPFFPNNEYSTTFAADKEIVQSNQRFAKMDPSLVDHVKKADYSIVHNTTKYTLLTLEAKSCKQKYKSATDLIKIGKYLKDTIDAAEKEGFADLRLVGLIASGDHVDVYIIAHDHDYIYTLYRLDTFHIPIDYTDIHRCIPAISIMPKLKNIVLSSIDVLNKPKKNLQTAALLHLETYHTPVALPGQKVKRVPNIQTSRKFQAARRKLF